MFLRWDQIYFGLRDLEQAVVQIRAFESKSHTDDTTSESNMWSRIRARNVMNRVNELNRFLNPPWPHPTKLNQICFRSMEDNVQLLQLSEPEEILFEMAHRIASVFSQDHSSERTTNNQGMHCWTQSEAISHFDEEIFVQWHDDVGYLFPSVSVQAHEALKETIEGMQSLMPHLPDRWEHHQSGIAHVFFGSAAVEELPIDDYGCSILIDLLNQDPKLLTIVQIAGRLDFDRATVSNRLQPMLQHAFVEQPEGDRKGYCLTRKGKRLATRILKRQH